jgi:hypothetical protein
MDEVKLSTILTDNYWVGATIASYMLYRVKRLGLGLIIHQQSAFDAEIPTKYFNRRG